MHSFYFFYNGVPVGFGGVVAGLNLYISATRATHRTMTLYLSHSPSIAKGALMDSLCNVYTVKKGWCSRVGFCGCGRRFEFVHQTHSRDPWHLDAV